MKFFLTLLLLNTLISLLSCKNNSRNCPVFDDSLTQRAKHEDIHTNYHDTTIASHSRDSTVDVLSDMYKHIRSIHKTNNMDMDFIEVLKVFNQAEVELSYLELYRGKDDSLRSMARIIKNRMGQFVDYWKNNMSHRRQMAANSDSFYKQLSNFLNQTVWNDNVFSKPFDLLYVSNMIMHHENALGVMKIYLAHATDNEARQLVTNLSNEYQEQILFLKKRKTLFQ